MRRMPSNDLPAADAPLAAIDMGSNSFRVEIARLVRGRYERIDYIKETVRLGGGLDANGLLGEDAAERGLATLRRFAARLQGFAPAQVRAVATQTLREAKNRDAFLLRAQAALGHSIEVISGREEARLIYAGVACLQPSERTRLVIDIGGRSTEMILGRGNDPLQAESFAVGSVSLSMRHFGDGKLTAAAFRAAQVAAGAELEEALQPFAPSQWEEALGSSGTAGAVSQLLVAMGHTDGVVTPERLRVLIERCIAAGRPHYEANVGGRKRGGVVDAVADHRHRPELLAQLAYGVHLALWQQVGADVVDANLGRQARRGRGGVAREHHDRLDAISPQQIDRVASAVARAIGDGQHANQPRVSRNEHRRGAVHATGLEHRVHVRRTNPEVLEQPMIAHENARAVDEAFGSAAVDGSHVRARIAD